MALRLATVSGEGATGENRRVTGGGVVDDASDAWPPSLSNALVRALSFGISSSEELSSSGEKWGDGAFVSRTSVT